MKEIPLLANTPVSYMNTWILWHSIMRIGYPESLPLWRTRPDICDSKEECLIAVPTAVSQYVEGLKKDQNVMKIVTVDDGYIRYIIKDHTHPSGKRDVMAHWVCYPAGFNPNDSH